MWDETKKKSIQILWAKKEKWKDAKEDFLIACE